MHFRDRIHLNQILTAMSSLRLKPLESRSNQLSMSCPKSQLGCGAHTRIIQIVQIDHIPSRADPKVSLQISCSNQLSGLGLTSNQLIESIVGSQSYFKSVVLWHKTCLLPCGLCSILSGVGFVFVRLVWVMLRTSGIPRKYPGRK